MTAGGFEHFFQATHHRTLTHFLPTTTRGCECVRVTHSQPGVTLHPQVVLAQTERGPAAGRGWSKGEEGSLCVSRGWLMAGLWGRWGVIMVTLEAQQPQKLEQEESM